MSRARIANDRAAEWIIQRQGRSWSDTDQAALDAWLGEADGNKAAYWRLNHGWKQADRAGALGSHVVRVSPGSRIRPWLRSLAIAASLAVVVGAGTSLSRYEGLHASRSSRMDSNAPAQTARFATAIGGRRIVPLQDGSKVELNTATVVREAMTTAVREVWLDEGEAYFEVAHREDRPFVIHAGRHTVTVLGTKFSVRRDEDAVTVCVVQGRVRVADEGDRSRATIITAGDVAVARGSSTFTVKAPEKVANTLSWRDGILTFDQSPLSSAAAEFNRYNHKPIVVQGATAPQLRIGGVFPAADPDAFVRLLRDAYGLHVEDREGSVIISDR